MFNFKSSRTLPQLRVEVSEAISIRVAAIEEGHISLNDLDIPSEKYARQNRRADEGPNDLNILAQAILDNTPASQLTPKNHSFLMNMMSYGAITDKQRKYLMDLADKYIGSADCIEAA